MTDTLSLLAAVLIFPGGLFVIALGLALKGVERRAIARLQRRIGPPLAQPVFDMVKLLQKRTLIPDTAQPLVFLAAPLVAVASMAVAAALIPVPGLYSPDPRLGDLIVLFYLITVPAVALMLAGSSSGSPFGAIGFSREMAIMLAYEGPILLSITAVALRVGAETGQPIALSLSEIVAWQRAQGSLLLDPWMWPAFVTYLTFVPANLGIAPFDIPEAESEILEGPLVEYSGPPLGLLKLASAMKAVVVLGLGVALFFPAGPGGLAGLAVFGLKCLGLVLAVAVLKAAVGRMRIDQAVIFYLKWPEALGLCGLALAVLRP